MGQKVNKRKESLDNCCFNKSLIYKGQTEGNSTFVGGDWKDCRVYLSPYTYLPILFTEENKSMFNHVNEKQNGGN